MKNFFKNLQPYQMAALIGFIAILLLSLFIHTYEPSTSSQVADTAANFFNEATDSGSSTSEYATAATAINLIIAGSFFVMNIVSVGLALLAKFKYSSVARTLLIIWNVLIIFITRSLAHGTTPNGLELNTSSLFVIQIIFEIILIILTALTFLKDKEHVSEQN